MDRLVLATRAIAPSTVERYAELLYAVGKKCPGESRHATALRYIRQAENDAHGCCNTAKKATL